MGIIKIGSSKNRKGVTVSPSTVLFNGNDVKSIKSGSTTIWGKSKPLVPTLTSNNGSDGGVASSSGIHTHPSPYYEFYAFDNNDSTCWVSGGYELNPWLQYSFAEPMVVNCISYRQTESYRINSAKIQGSNNGEQWDDLSDVFNVEKDNEVHKKHIDNTKSYIHYRFSVTSASDYTMSLYHLQFYGYQP